MGQSIFTGYIGTYTKGKSKGVYSFKVDTENGKLEKAEVAAELTNPTYVTISGDERFLYAVAKEGEKGGLAAYEIDGTSGQLTLLNAVTEKSGSPCHVSVDPENRFAVAAYYHDGTAVLYTVNPETGALDEQVSIAQQEGSGPNQERQDGPHMHFGGFTPDGKYIAGVDLGTDEVITYEYKNGHLMDVHRLAVAPGAGPRHLTFHPNGATAYLMTELSNEVIVLRYESGVFTAIQTISAIPSDFTENSQGSAIHISSDGRFVYAGNRGHDSIAVFEVNPENDELALVEYTPTGGSWPRDFVLDPTEKFVIATNQESSNVVLFTRDQETGKLSQTDSVIEVPDPVCVKFLSGK
ncbi:lactonase family protein [Jeotgalibacillus soli]|uniref:6-phosphogluconolactonase n=1 Tax=Jeotgalibacillus soli TaxID=889306 RepID=A0A0C2SDD7_9BACL|nr:lactonase family protein [Jeotgalibacillus soli]KIL51989.1 hypothetical protein KP78_03590 [Jeotgalibacillus soli]